MASFYISAAHKSSGKTTLSIGLSAAIRQRGLSLQTFKKGPDYIDPMWLQEASGAPCYNLDFYTSGNDFIVNGFNQHAHQQDVVLVEGNMGLYDGISLDGSDSNAAMAQILGLPVLLVVDCSGTSRGIAPLLNGYQQFGPGLEFAGVILNKIAGERHLGKLQNVIQAYTDFTILGALPRNEDISMTERHLGLIPSNEIADQSSAVIQLLAQQINEHIDVDRILTIDAHELPRSSGEHSEIHNASSSGLRIALAMDEAFGFYYPGDLEHFRHLGVELVPFSTLTDPALPANIDGLFIGGGFPETQLAELSANTSLRQDIKQAIDQGLPSYAECGGLMYLCRDLSQGKQSYPLCDVIPASVAMHKKPQGRGYVQLQINPAHPWYQGHNDYPQTLSAHEFHHSALSGLTQISDYAYSIKRGTGIDGVNDGIIINNLVASYTHLRQTDQCFWVDDFVSFVKTCKSQSKL